MIGGFRTIKTVVRATARIITWVSHVMMRCRRHVNINVLVIGCMMSRNLYMNAHISNWCQSACGIVASFPGKQKT